MQDEQNLERVKLTFDKFNIPMATDHSCEDGYLKVKYALGYIENRLKNDRKIFDIPALLYIL